MEVKVETTDDGAILRIKNINAQFNSYLALGIKRMLQKASDSVIDSITHKKDGVKTDTGRLRGSFSGKSKREGVFEVLQSGNSVAGTFGSNLKYARIQEYGGTITGKNGMLAIPIDPSAKGKSPRSFDNLTLISRKGAPLLVRFVGGKKARGVIMYVLKNSVTIPPHLYLHGSLERAKAEMITLFEDTMKEGIDGKPA